MIEQFLGLASFEVAVQQFFTALIDDTGVHFVGVQVDSAVEWVFDTDSSVLLGLGKYLTI